MSVVIGGVIFTNQMAQHSSMLSSLPPQVASQLAGGSAGASSAIVQSLPPDQRDPVLQAYTESLDNMWIFYTCTAFASFAISLLIGKRTLSKEHEEMKTGLAAQEEERKEREERRRSKRASANVAADVEKALGEGKIDKGNGVEANGAIEEAQGAAKKDAEGV